MSNKRNTSNAPAKAHSEAKDPKTLYTNDIYRLGDGGLESVGQGPCALSDEQQLVCRAESRLDLGSGPASKPLVVGQTYALSSIPEGARVADLSTGDEWEIRGRDALGRVIDSDGDYRESHLHKRLVALPSAVDAERSGRLPLVGFGGKTSRPLDPDPAPPALTREEVVNIWLTMMRAYDNHSGGYEDSLEAARVAALSDGGAR